MTYPKTVRDTEGERRFGKGPEAAWLAVTAAVLLLAAAGAAAEVAADKILALKGGTVYTGTRGSLDGGVILIKGGRIAEIGTGILIPPGAEVVDVAGKFIMAGVVSPDSCLGVSKKAEKEDTGRGAAPEQAGKNLAWYPILYSLDPSHDDFALALRNGFTANACSPPPAGISGLGTIMRPVGKTFESCIVRDRAFLKISLYVNTPFENMLRRSLEAARQKLESLKAEEEKKAKEALEKKNSGKGRGKDNASSVKKTEDEAPDETTRVFMDVVEGKLAVVAECLSADAVAHLVDIINGYPKIRIIIKSASEGAPAADLLKGRKIPIILEPVVTLDKHWTSYSYATNVTKWSSLVKWKDFGPEIAIQAPGSVEDQIHLFDYLNEQRRIGIDRELLLQGVTIVPARILGIADAVGSLDKGKLADLLIFASDPLENVPCLERVMLNGEFVR